MKTKLVPLKMENMQTSLHIPAPIKKKQMRHYSRYIVILILCLKTI